MYLHHGEKQMLANSARLSTRPRRGPKRTEEEDAAYAAVEHALRSDHTHRETQLCLTYLWNFAVRYDPLGKGRLSVIEGSRDGCEHATLVWAHMCQAAKWSTHYQRTVQRRLAHALWYVVQAVAVVIDPAVRARTHTPTVETDGGFLFNVHGVLPRPVRALPDHHVRYRTLTRLVLGIVPHLRAVSKPCLQRTARTLDRILCATGWDTDPWHVLAERTAEEWLCAYERAHPTPSSIGFTLFKRDMRTLSIVYEHVLGHKASLPIPRSATASYGTKSVGVSFGASSSSSSSSSSSAATDAAAQRLRLRTKMGDMRRILCRHANGTTGDHEVQTAFTPGEVERILQAAATPLERLVIALLLSTGLRIGGLARLRVPCGIPVGGMPRGRDAPATLVTVEKGSRTRTVQLSHSVRRSLVMRVPASTPHYVFPGRGGRGHGSPRAMWAVCHRIFERAEVTGAHVHPHTLRHTVVHLLYLAGGMTFEQIAKWLGHSNPGLTSSVYGRIQSLELHSMVPFADTMVAEEVRTRWKGLAQRVQYPFPFPYEDWSGLWPPPWLRGPPPPTAAVHGDTQSIIHELRKLAHNLEHHHHTPTSTSDSKPIIVHGVTASASSC